MLRGSNRNLNQRTLRGEGERKRVSPRPRTKSSADISGPRPRQCGASVLTIENSNRQYALGGMAVRMFCKILSTKYCTVNVKSGAIFFATTPGTVAAQAQERSSIGAVYYTRPFQRHGARCSLGNHKCDDRRARHSRPVPVPLCPTLSLSRGTTASSANQKLVDALRSSFTCSARTALFQWHPGDAHREGACKSGAQAKC